MLCRNSEDVSPKERYESHEMLLVPEQNKIGAAMNSEFCEDIRDVELNGTLRDLHPGSNLFVG